MQKYFGYAANDKAFTIIDIGNINVVRFTRDIDIKWLGKTIFYYSKVQILVTLSKWNNKWLFSLVLFSLHPDSEISDPRTCLVIELKLSSSSIWFIDIYNSSFSNKCSTWNSFTFKFNNPHSSTFWDSFNLNIIGLDTVWITIIRPIVIRVIWMHVREILCRVNITISFIKMFL